MTTSIRRKGSDMTGGRNDARVILVGVDGSPGSLRAMRWAVEEAQVRGSAIEAVTVWSPGSTHGAGSSAAASQVQARVLREAVAGVDPEPLISAETEIGAAEEVLVTRSEHASLLVVGSHGVGSVRHAALGSTSEYCSRMAACPVVVVPQEVPSGLRADLAVQRPGPRDRVNHSTS